MKQINNHTANAISQIHGTTFSVFLIANIFISGILEGKIFPKLLENLSPTWLLVISAVIDATLYAILYFIVKSIFDFFLIRKDPKLDIAGRWYHVHIPRLLGEIDYTAKRLSAGYTDISRELYDFTFNGYNQHLKPINGEVVPIDDYSTHWYSKASKLAEDNQFDIIEIYEAESKGKSIKELDMCPCCKTKFANPVPIPEAENSRYGIHTFKFLENENNTKCEQIEADFTDCWPSLKNGDLLFFRTKEARDEYIKRYFAIAEEKNNAQ